MKNRRKKKEKIGYLDKSKYCVGTESSALAYISILVTSTTTGPSGSVVSALASKQKVGVQFPVVVCVFFAHNYFFILPFHLCPSN